MLARLMCVSLFAAVYLTGAIAWSAEWPVHAVTLVVPYTAGGSVDVTARILAKQLSEQEKQPFVVENKPGAAGVIGAQYVSTSRADGYRLMYGSTALSITASTMRDTSIDLARDLTPISKIVSQGYLLVTNPSLPANSVGELVAWAKSHPDQLKWGHSGVGSTTALCIEQFDKIAGLKPQVIPYNGGAPNLVAVVGGEINASLMPNGPIKSFVESGQLRVLAATTRNPIPALPKLPTINSPAFPDYDCGFWTGVFGPAKMPADLVTQIHLSLQKALTQASLKDAMHANDLDIAGSKSPEEFVSEFDADIQKFGAIVKDLGLQSP